jgi:nucleotide-binding universal stress UspA family protein
MAREPFGPVVVGVDVSTSMAAVVLAAEEALARVAPLIVVSVHDGTALGASAGRRLVEVAAARARAEHPGLSVAATSVSGDPVHELIALTYDASLVVLDRPNRGRSGGMPIASVSGGVVQRSAVPVLLHAPLDHSGATAVPRPVVLGVGGSPASDAAAEFAFGEAALRGVGLHAVYVWSADGDGASIWMPADPGRVARARESAELALDDTLVRWMEKYPEVRVRRALRHGLDVPVALTAASRAGQLLVVGTHHQTSPLIEALVHRTGCPIALVPVN